MIQEQFDNIIKDFTVLDEILAVAVSGGADSMCLLSLCLNSPHIKSENLLVVSVDHGIRGERSKADLEFVGEFCRTRGIAFLRFFADIPARCKQSGRGTETEAREARRDIFKNLIADGRAGKVLTAHHTSDNAESLLMHIFRGCGLTGLRGLEALSDGFLLRPLLTIEKSEIDAYIVENRIPFVTDETNADSAFTRNFIRNEVLPKIKEKYPAAERALIRLGEEARKTEAFLNRSADDFVAVEGGCARIRLENQNSFLLPYRIFAALDRLNGRTDIESKHIAAVAALAQAENGTGVDLPNRLRAVKEYDSIAVYRTDNRSVWNGAVPFKPGKTILYKGLAIAVEQQRDSSARLAAGFFGGGCQPDRLLFFDIRKIPQTAVFRRRKEGDIFCPFGGGTKKLKKYLIDKKIPLRLRNQLICIADGCEILAVAGVEISEKIKITEGSEAYSFRLLNE